MEVNIMSIILIFSFIYPIFLGFLQRFSSVELKKSIISIELDIGSILALFLGLFFLKRIFFQHDFGIYKKIYEIFPKNFINYMEAKPYLLYLMVLPMMILLFYEIIKSFFYLLNITIIFPVLDGLERSIQGKSNFVKRFLSATFQIPKSICYVIVLTVIFNILVFANINSTLNDYLSSSKIYNYICRDVIVPIANSKVTRQIPNIINNSMKIEIKEASKNVAGTDTVIYYNGITLEEGVKSNSTIDNFARSLVSKAQNDDEKARILYEWIGRNIEYDDEKAKKILNNDFEVKSGAIAAFTERKGICFDYSCLYIAMCRAVDLDVRLITGEGFNGISWVSHAWNQVYVNNQWVNVDTTFYKGGNYYNSSRFNIDHRNASVEAEWK
ncbi:putative protein involved in cytokinesis, contains TGc (transglutaminase/protease-like) domain [Clostridium sp. N3C]|mgnify:CR=1 FL=1|uniref:transglutaminase domain-containing protein n=1 Tax=Clostridium sp. N3C TaxID=1776758 RepID=UPI00092E07A9|nr:transglutaminase domain-containing protein [Clostridium sp. N3C]SCN21414.1 putative protein involved in cytokinesis, contains TGc (transglutaminase/protease-like) domain [Clostridium sp. N3C]